MYVLLNPLEARSIDMAPTSCEEEITEIKD